MSEQRTRVVHIDRPDGEADYYRVLREGFAACGLIDRVRAARTIFIKPNLVTDNLDYIQRGANTDTRVIEAMLRILREENAHTIRLGESETGTPVKGRRLQRALDAMELPALCRRFDVQLVNLTHEPTVRVPIPRSDFLPSIDLARCFVDSDLIIDMPKIKTHKYATITCALKNMFGAIPDPLRIVYHKNIHETLAALNSVLFDRTVVVCDGLVAMEGAGPMWGTSRPLGLLLVAPDPLSCDRVVHQIMGFPREAVRHIVLSEQMFGRDIGPDPEVSGLAIADVSGKFEPAHKNWWIRLEEELMRHRSVVRVVFHPHVQRRLIYPVRHVFARLRGGMYTWYVDDK
jgi:uncharacterized protein (DUF362 family)